jgi:predicted  nucleic acid-binding Zn-ribbon protein
MELNRFNAKLTGQEMIEKLQEENNYLRNEIIEEKVKTDGNISALNAALEETKEDNQKLTKQIDDYMDLKEHYSNLKKQGII